MKRKSVLIGIVAVCLLLVGSAVVFAQGLGFLTGFNKEFQAIGTSVSSNSSCSASVSTSGKLSGQVIGQGTYVLCLNPDTPWKAGNGAAPPAGNNGAAPPAGNNGAAPPAGGGAAPPADGGAAPAGGGSGGSGGTLVFTDLDGDCTFTLNIAGLSLSNSTILGTYVVAPAQSTGKFAHQIKAGSGTFELSMTGNDDTISIDGVFTGH
jgi:hypothetical protein